MTNTDKNKIRQDIIASLSLLLDVAKADVINYQIASNLYREIGELFVALRETPAYTIEGLTSDRLTEYLKSDRRVWAVKELRELSIDSGKPMGLVEARKKVEEVLAYLHPTGSPTGSRF